MMLDRRVLTALALLPAMLGQGAIAAEVNKREHLDPRLNAKVQSHIAKGWQQRPGGQGGSTGAGGAQAGCGGQAIGNVQVGKGGQAPKEVNTIITGDVINVVRPGACN
jgi:hypothetical protein